MGDFKKKYSVLIQCRRQSPHYILRGSGVYDSVTFKYVIHKIQHRLIIYLSLLSVSLRLLLLGKSVESMGSEAGDATAFRGQHLAAQAIV